MRHAVRLLCVFALLSLAWLSPAAAQPDPSCAKKFIGLWAVTIVSTGQKFNTDILANGTAVSHCPLCSPLQWTCSGNTFSVPTASQTLSPDGRTLTGGCCVATRIGGRAVAATSDGAERPAKPSAREKPSKREPNKPQRQEQPQQAVASDSSCDGAGKGSTHCKDANSLLTAARSTRGKYPALSAEAYRDAAAAARRAGDDKFEARIVNESSK